MFASRLLYVWFHQASSCKRGVKDSL